jgi:hypothetical protein
VLTASIIRALRCWEAVSTSETSVNFYQTTRRHIQRTDIFVCLQSPVLFRWNREVLFVFIGLLGVRLSQIASRCIGANLLKRKANKAGAMNWKLRPVLNT